MALNQETNDDGSFIILGTSPGASLDMKCNGVLTSDSPLTKEDIEDAMKDLSVEANMAFKAKFQLGDCPSPASMMVASTIVSDDKSTEELQKRFGEILDENVVLKETLRQNNESMKEQFMLIASCQEDMLNTHKMHKEKFDETRVLVEKLRQENKKLKSDMTRLNESFSNNQSCQVNCETGEQVDSLTKSQQSVDKSSDRSSCKSGPSSTIEFVTSPDDDTINKLTAQLELVEKQRRQVIVENEKLTWQKESLENIVDATSKERDDLKEKLKRVELENSSKVVEHVTEVQSLNYTIDELQKKLMSSSTSDASLEAIKKRDAIIQQLESKLLSLRNELKAARLNILELENVKLEFSRQKAGTTELAKLHRDQIQELNSRLKDAQTVVFQPVRFSISSESDTAVTENAAFIANVKLYDRTLKHLGDLLNSIANGTSDTLIDALGLVTSLLELKLDRTSADRVRTGMYEVKNVLEKQHSAALTHMTQIKGTLSIFEGIFQDYKEFLKRGIAKQDNPQTNPNIEALTSALVARGRELEANRQELNNLRSKLADQRHDTDEKDLLRAQIEIYRSDFEAERQSREKMASEKETLATELRATKKLNQDLSNQLDAVRKISPGIFQQTVSKPKVTRTKPTRPDTAAAIATDMVYTCPKCMRFSSDQYKVMEDHFDVCLDNDW